MSVNYDFWATDGDVMTDIFGGYNFGYTDYDVLPKKCTITEIMDDDDFEDDLEEEDINIDDLSKAFDNIIEDWKIKMEVIIGDGLKKLRKSHKERKLMMKYLPGDKKVQCAKQSIAKDWKIDFQKAFGTTHKKLEKLAADKAKEVDCVVKTDAKEPQVNKYKKKVVNINMKANPDSAYGNLKNLIQQLDKMINTVQNDSPTLHSIPIYSKEARGQVLPAYSNQWLELQKSILRDLDQRQSFLDVLEDFKIKFNQDKVMKKVTKSRIEGTNVVNAQKRMLERKNQHFLKQFKKNGKEHFLLVKKKAEIKLDAADIFADWKNNLVDVFEQRRQAALAARKNRTRKLSNRALRKELLREIDAEEQKKPLSYSDMVKKNLKPPMEDIFEAWRDYLQELDEIINNDSRTSFCKDEEAEDILESAKSFQKELHFCGQPTVKSAKNDKFSREIFFASWRHNLVVPEEELRGQEARKYEAENIFAGWKFNLNEPKNEVDDFDMEAYFDDWIQNFEPPCLSRSESKMLKNKQRNQRRSKKSKH